MGFDNNNIPQFDLNYANDMLDSIQRDQEGQLRAIECTHEERRKREA